MGIDHMRDRRMPLMWDIAAKRGTQWIFGSEENILIREGDVLFARGPMKGEK